VDLDGYYPKAGYVTVREEGGVELHIPFVVLLKSRASRRHSATRPKKRKGGPNKAPAFLPHYLITSRSVSTREGVLQLADLKNNSSTSTSEAKEANNSDSEYQLFLSTSSSANVDDPAGKQYQPIENIPNAVVCVGKSRNRRRRMPRQATVKMEKECGIVHKKYRGKGGEDSARKPGPDC
ncbi:hypothetical protein C0J52_25450, partial [Blattella germanica]